MSNRAKKDMFSAATFFDVLSAPSAKVEAVAPVPRRPPVVAFYGFRGGAGRTIALAHVAALLARRGTRLALVDLDLEAPGLHNVLAVATPPDGAGVAFAIRAEMEAGERGGRGQDDRLVERHLFQVPDVGGELLLVPSGPIGPKYLAAIEELNVAHWHAMPTSPLMSFLSSVARVRPELEAIFLDCRTGFHGMTATALYHIADLIVLIVPLSAQIWDGLEAIMDGIRVARSHRAGAPQLLLVPAMVPLGEMGTARLGEFQERILKLYADKVGILEDSTMAEDPDQPSWLLNGIRYDQEIALGGMWSPRLKGPAADGYEELANAIASSLGLVREQVVKSGSPTFDTSKVLHELRIPRSTAYAEEIPSEELDDLFINSSDYARIVDRLTALVIGAKGAGKTLLWRKLLRETNDQHVYVPGHGPAQLSNKDSGLLNLSPDTLKEIEVTAKLERNANHRAFWRLYAAARVFAAVPAAKTIDFGKQELLAEERRVLRQLVAARSAVELSRVLGKALVLPTASTFSEKLLDRIDEVLTEQSVRPVALLYDGLDTGFDVGKASVEMRRRFVAALLQTVAEARSRYRRLIFKVFLREDVWFESELQNKSHLDAARADLVWRAVDLWRIALQLAMTSATYRKVADQIAPASSKVEDELVLKRVLVPLWGETIESGKSAFTANYIQKRMSDAEGRLFPRTFVQLLETAVEEEKKQKELLANRVLRFTSIRQGMREASKQRVRDLRTEYTALGEYLELLRGTEATATPEEWASNLRRKWLSVARKRRNKGAPKGALHAGPGGWGNVVDYLRLVGVLGPYMRADRPKLQVALLYRFGLEVKGSGLQ